MPTGAQICAAALIPIGAVLCVALVEAPATARLPELVLLLGLSAAASWLRLSGPWTAKRAALPASFVVDFTALLVLGPHQAIPVVVVGAVSESCLRGRRMPVHRVLYAAAASVVTIEAAGVAYAVFGGSIGDLTQAGLMTGAVAAAITYFLVQTGLAAVTVSASSGQPVQSVWRESFLGSGLNYFMGAAAAGLFAFVITHQLWALVPLAVVPVYLTHRAYLGFIARLAEEHGGRRVLETLDEGLALVDRQGSVLLWNDALGRLLGRAPEQALGRRLVDLLPESARNPVASAVHWAIGNQTAQRLDLTMGEGVTRRILDLRVIPSPDGATIRWADVTERAEAERALKRSEERYALAASGANDGLWDWDLVSGEVYFSQRWKALVGLSAEERVTGVESWFGRVHPEDRAALQRALQAHIQGDTEQFHHEHRIQNEDGSCRWVLGRGAALRDREGRATRIAGSLIDVTKWAQSRERLREAALHDTLTGLPNRRLFTELLRRTLNRCRETPGRRCAVLFLDIDQFKAVNDTLGHLAGDELLVKVAERLRSCLREGDVLARLSGDEFTILLAEVQSGNQACATAFRIQEAIRAPLGLGGRELSVSVSIGIAVSSREYTSPDEIMRDADGAMYKAKARGKARHEIFDADMRAEDVERLTMENDLRQAIERGQLVLHYQPIVALATGAWTGFEALLRWERGGRMLAPEQFIALAEEIGAIEPIGEWVLREACRQFGEWRRRYPALPLSAITVNVSPRQLVQADFLAIVARAIEDAGLAPGELRLEITETSLMARPERVAEVLREVRALGVQIYLDDFGTGFSSLSHLHRLPVDALKIDRSFVASLRRRDRPAIVESILALARTLDTLVIAEGVESVEQMQELTRLGCGQGQGFLFSAPMPAPEADARLQQVAVDAPGMPADGSGGDGVPLPLVPVAGGQPAVSVSP